ncbi:hypothetical protein L9F63_012281, partial [Diploptera punctata]
NGCKYLTDDIQSNIALKFTDCFLSMSGLETYECENSLKKKDCVKRMTDRSFNVYTEFYTHTINMCFFLESQMWHEETEKTIDRLSTSSARVSRQLEEAETVQEILLEQQRKSMTVQQELLANGLSLSEIILTSQDNLHAIMHEFKTSTHEQKKMLFEVFDRLASLQNWAVGEISWLDTIIFYVSCIIVSYVITATPRTYEARIWIFLTVTINAVFERTIVTYLLQDNFDHIEVFNENLNWWIWQCRKIMLSICAIFIGYAVYHYCDYNAVNHKLLIEIQKQNMEVIHHLQKIKLADNILNKEISNLDKVSEEEKSLIVPSRPTVNVNDTFPKIDGTAYIRDYSSTTSIFSNDSGTSSKIELDLSPRVLDIHNISLKKLKEKIISPSSRPSSRSSSRSYNSNQSEMTLQSPTVEIRPTSRYSLRNQNKLSS